eukprot:449005_1
MKYLQLMGINHLIALMLYCNFDIFSFEFSKTFRKLHQNEDDNSMIKRHLNFFWLARLLRECVECYGMFFTKYEAKKKPIKAYHGTNQHFTFCAMDAYIKGPFSTTLDYTVAVNFCANKGMILELSLSTDCISTNNVAALRRICYFDMQWISKYPNEQEIFSVGGISSIGFESIIDADVAITYACNYQIYVNGLRRMMSGMFTEIGANYNEIMTDSDPNCQFEKQMAFRLLAHQVWKHKPNHACAYEFKNCPDYMNHVLDWNCQRVKYIDYYEKGRKLQDVYFKHNNEWLNLEMITTIFPNTQIISYHACNKSMEFWMNISMFESVLRFLNNNND